MNKREEANLKVKLNITNALFSLMETKSLSEIHITELVERAGVARASFYRNYSSKEDVLATLIRDVLAAFGAEADYTKDTFYTYENVLLSFQYFQKYRDYVLDLCRSGYGTAILEALNHFHEGVAGSMPASSIDRYQLYLYIGALFNTALVWLSEDGRTSPEEIAGFFHQAAVRMLA